MRSFTQRDKMLRLKRITNLKSIANHFRESNNSHILSFTLYLPMTAQWNKCITGNKEHKTTRRNTLAFPIERQKLESRASAETGKDSPYLWHASDSSQYECCHVKCSTLHLQNHHTHKLSDITYSNSFSRKTTGSGSLMAAFNRPRASSELYGASTFNPGHEAYHAA